MLEELNVHNYALIDRVTVKFTSGLNILTGETGAGKSILVGALGLILGKKADASVIRTGAEEALVSGIINVKNNKDALEWLSAHGIPLEDDSIIIRRMIKQQGRSSVYIGSTPVTRPELEEFGALLFDMHGQHDNQSLLNEANHRRLLDCFAGIEDSAEQFKARFLELSELRERYGRIINSERERLRQIEMLKYSIDEIKSANLEYGEEERLATEKNILANHERLYRLIEEIYSGISESSSGALSTLRLVMRAMDDIVQIDPGLTAANNQFQDSFFELEDFTDKIRHYKDQIIFDPGKLETIEERLVLIHTLKKKYGNSIDEVLKYAAKCESELQDVENSEFDKEYLKKRIQELEKIIRDQAASLTDSRKKAALSLQAQVISELQKLGMPKVSFKVSVEERKNDDGRLIYSMYGADTIEFLISPNQGEPFKNLKKIVSGGEISRIMLSLKKILAHADNINTLIFDEIDAGIGGEIAISVGQSLVDLSMSKQVLCITHLATIAVRAHNHIKIKKIIKDNRTFTSADTIKGEQIREEIARMLAGDQTDDISLNHAQELLKKYTPLKET